MHVFMRGLGCLTSSRPNTAALYWGHKLSMTSIEHNKRDGSFGRAFARMLVAVS
jgi:hypothetical protein